jgi:hypothetical protein
MLYQLSSQHLPLGAEKTLMSCSVGNPQKGAESNAYKQSKRLSLFLCESSNLTGTLGFGD